MEVCDFLSKRFNTDTYISTYIEAEWWDKITELCKPIDYEQFEFLKPRHSHYYEEMASFVYSSIPKLEGNVCDIGCAAGRFIYELLNFDNCINRVDAIEPSEKLCEFTNFMLLHDVLVKYIPIINNANTCINLPITQMSTRFKTDVLLNVYNASFEEYSKNSCNYDIIFCLNVIDRHPDPQHLIKVIKSKIKSKGYLCLASPFDWNEKFTAKDKQISDIKLYFDKEWKIIAEKDFKYPFRFHSRELAEFYSYTLLLQYCD